MWTDASGLYNGGVASTIVGRKYGPLGNPVTGEVNLVPSSPKATSSPDIAALPSNGIAVAYLYEFSPTDHDVYVRTFDSNLASPHQYTIDFSGLDGANPSVTTFADGSLFVSYTQKNRRHGTFSPARGTMTGGSPSAAMR